MSVLCGECRYLNTKNKKDGQCFCTEKEEYRFANSNVAEECSRFFRLGWGHTSEGKEAIAEAEKYQKEYHGDCFITTVVVEILGFDDKCEALEVLRKFRREVLQTSAQYRNILLQYDVVGPLIAKSLKNDENAYEVSLDVYFDYILKSVDALYLGDIEGAILVYEEMVLKLGEHYGIAINNYHLPNDRVYDQSCGGHGRLKLV